MRLPVLEVGGTHVTAAVVQLDDGDGSPAELAGSVRLELDADGDADVLIARLAEAARMIAAPPDATWAVAIPDPFDYVRGVGLFEGVGKFAALRGVDVAAALRDVLGARPAFLNDADAFAIGEWAAGAAMECERCVGLTLGTGVGSGWLVEGRVVDPGAPPGARMHRVTVAGRPLEEIVSRRAIRRAHVSAGGDPAADVREIAALARAGEQRAQRVVDAAMSALGAVVGPLAAGFAADVLVLGGSMSASWDVFGPPFEAAAESALGHATRSGVRRTPVRVSALGDAAPLIGAAVHAQRVVSAR